MSDTAKRALDEAERRAFDHYGLDVRSHFFQLDDPSLRVRVLESGSGPPLLLLGGPSASTWAPLMAELRGYRLLAVDRPGSGMSDPFDYRHVDLREHAVRFVSGVMDKLELNEAGFVGSSMGGLWGFWMAVDHPDRIASIGQLGCPALLLGTSAPLSNRVMSVRGLNRVAPPSFKQGGSIRLGGHEGLPGVPDPMRECLYRAKLTWVTGRTHMSILERTLHLTGARPEVQLDEATLSGIGQPVLFVWGEHDEYGPPEAGRRACAIMPRAQMMVIPAGHLPWIEQPSECGAALQAFFQPAARALDATDPAAVSSVGIARSHRDPAPPTPGTELEWVRAVLWPGSTDLAPDRSAGRGRDGAEVFAVFPSASRPLLLTPLATRATASASLRRYNALRPPKRRFIRASVGLGLRLGVAQPFLRHRVWFQDGHPSNGEPALADRLREVFGVPEVIASVSLSRPGPFRKPLLQAMTPGGKVLGYAKVGWNDLTRELVRAEAATLARFQNRGLDAIGVPGLLYSGPAGPLEVCVTAPLPTRIRRYDLDGPASTLNALWDLAELGGLEQAPMAESVYWASMRERLSNVGKIAPGRTADILAGFATRLEAAHGAQSLTFGFWHGDWVPWNLGFSQGRLFAWDWEHSSANIPVGFDVFHFWFQLGFIANRKGFSRAVLEGRDHGLGLLASLGVSRPAGDVVFSLYLLEAFLRYHLPSISGAGRDRRFESDSALHLFEGASTGLASRP